MNLRGCHAPRAWSLSTYALVVAMALLSGWHSHVARAGGVMCRVRDYLGVYETEGGALGVEVSSHITYAPTSWGLQIVDITVPQAPVLLGAYQTPDIATDVALANGLAFVAGYSAGLLIVDVSDPAAPILVGSYNTPGFARHVALSGSVAYVADKSGGLQIIDVSDPADPNLIGSITGIGEVRGVCVVGTTAYLTVAGYGSGLRIFDVSDPTAPEALGTFQWPSGYAEGVLVVGGIAYAAAALDGLQVIDVSDPAHPVLRACVDALWACESQIVGNIAYVADYRSGISVVDIADPSSPVVLGHFYTPGAADDLRVVDGIAYVADSDYGLQIIDVSDHGVLPVLTKFESAGAQAVTVVGSIAYLSSSEGLQVLDLTDPLAPVLLGSTQTLFPAQQIVVSNGTAYLRNEAIGFQIVDVSDPHSPVPQGAWMQEPHDYFWDICVTGGVVVVATSANTQFVDVTDPNAPKTISTLPGPKVEVEADGHFVYLTGPYPPGLSVLDIADPASPKLIGTLNILGAGAGGLAVDQDVLYILSAANGRGLLEIVDIADPSSPSALSSYWTYAEYFDVVVDYPACYLGRLEIVDVTNPAMPAFAGWTGLPGSLQSATGDIGYATSGEELLVIDLSDCPPCTADLDDSGAVDLFDVLVFVNLFNAADPRADCDKNNTFDLFDFLCFVNAFNAGC